ncbi:MAG TPA: efflux RND transporter periplasmic adaptor subunit [Stenotrophomonas sp.]|nr:efflux RND transporter periplasmic adaptor subunit [Stenotrophomonas sp.]
MRPSTVARMKGNPLALLLAGPLVALLLSGCGGGEPPPPPPTPALVVQPVPASGPGMATFPGEVRARQESALAFRVGGHMVKRLVDAGARVQRGQVLAELDPADLALQARSAQAQFESAQADLARARDDYQRYAKLVDQQLVSRSTFDAQTAAYKAAQNQAEAARANLDVARNQAAYAQLLAPADGVIASRQAEAGQVVAAGQTVFTLAAHGAREIAINLPESGAHRFNVGDRAEVELWGQPGKRLPGTIREIAPAADSQTRTHAARVALATESLDNVELGQSARVYLAGADAGGLTLPLSAIQRGAQGATTVWVVNPADGKVQARPVRIGGYASDQVPVLSGVAAGDWVVAAGGHLLREGQQVTPVDRSNRPLRAPAPPSAAPTAKR